MRTVHKARDNTSSEDDDEGEWLSARKLQAGDLIKTANGTWRQVVSIELETRHETVYNFEVEDNHNYFVGEIGFLVHNNNCGLTIGEKISGGHSFIKHFLEKADVSMGGTGIRTIKQWGEYIDDVIKNAPSSNVKQLARGRTGYWDDELQIVIIVDPRRADGGTAFRPDAGRQYFDNLQ